MSRTGDLVRLAALAGLQRDVALARHAAAAAVCRRTEGQMATLVPLPPSAAVDPVAAERNAQAYARWAEERRARLAEMLAVQSAARGIAKEAAGRAFARAAALERLADASAAQTARRASRRRDPA